LCFTVERERLTNDETIRSPFPHECRHGTPVRALIGRGDHGDGTRAARKGVADRDPDATRSDIEGQKAERGSGHVAHAWPL